MSGRRAILFGAGGHARAVRALLPHVAVRFAVEDGPGPEDLLQAAVLEAGPDADTDYFVAIGDGAARRRCRERLNARGFRVATCVAPTAWVSPDAELGEGGFVGPGAVVGANTRLGAGVIVNTLASIDHDCVVGDDVQLTPGVTLGSHLRIGADCYFGMKSCVLPRLELGAGVRVMAGTLVVRSAPPGVVLGGSPARVMQRPAPAADEG